MEYLTLYEALRLLPVSKPTLYNLVKKGIVRRIKLPGVRKYLYSRADLQALLDDHTLNPLTHRLDL